MARQTTSRRTNDEWVAALRGDLGYESQEAAFRDLADYLYRVAYNHLRSRSASVPGLYHLSYEQLAQLAEDFTQSTLVKIYEKRLYNTYQSGGRFLSYMAVVAINEVKQAIRLKAWWIRSGPLPSLEPEYESENGDHLPPLPPELTTASESDLWPQLEEVWGTIQQCVELLPERWRQAFLWIVFEDLATAEVKDRLHASSEGAVYILVSRARSRLKSCLAEAGWDLDDVWRLFQ